MPECYHAPRPLPAPWCDYEGGGWVMVRYDPLRGVGVRTMAVDLGDVIEHTFQTFQIPEAINAILDANRASQSMDNAERRKLALSPLSIVARIPEVLKRQWEKEIGPDRDGNQTAWKRRLNDPDYRLLRTDPSRKL